MSLCKESKKLEKQLNKIIKLSIINEFSRCFKEMLDNNILPISLFPIYSLFLSNSPYTLFFISIQVNWVEAQYA